MSNRSKKNKQKSQPVTPDAILAVVRMLESHTSDPEDALMVLAATAHSLMTSLDVHIIESRSPDGLGITLTRTDEENKQKAGRLHLH
ncbi:hypothetical protein DLB95_21625 [Salmonella enterica subsp. diarizonae]|uniref:Uncharacterized protein n=1 Tax=Salmonella diarizonae TaxID=59204 RepID=A0A5Y3W777_SALDZ|nr:hypothetical protein [Salmonella enterica]EAA6550500.1 hypothetical protein [Salmonella enterica subsp. diarizonae]EBS3400174.1 hypothetical protein [Salmonella enterica subsp. enterica serovar Hvittingfoss]ECO0809233.1 hypothetical protein [Salmonella enterica subsp. enterica serovar Newport]EDJ0582295.1 hypothetical protein [Salmonella enterica subsp. enterica serovar Rubislaw]EDT0981818.1 hypothetical protein [Salmonella enterica subsp. enterica serovar Mikawasima]EHK8846390.1 hypotheti